MVQARSLTPISPMHVSPSSKSFDESFYLCLMSLTSFMIRTHCNVGTFWRKVEVYLHVREVVWTHMMGGEAERGGGEPHNDRANGNRLPPPTETPNTMADSMEKFTTIWRVKTILMNLRPPWLGTEVKVLARWDLGCKRNPCNLCINRTD